MVVSGIAVVTAATSGVSMICTADVVAVSVSCSITVGATGVFSFGTTLGATTGAVIANDTLFPLIAL
ncbi:MAG: hypothetical protein AAB637_01225 [Patescibacteria group bacterium]